MVHDLFGSARLSCTPTCSLLTVLLFFWGAGQDCAGKEPVIDPPSLVVKYGEPATANCSAQSNATIIGWETTVGAKTEENTQQLVWSVPSVTEWALERGIKCFTTSDEDGQCETDLPITIYSK